ncbi:hypothetical protein [Sphingobacterium faecium]|uniref:hypothetical protein n=1 Tax=Sphingobacterium faecium TaxID=34087 RepID=UPI00246829B0|nr:hypothetical protein [Sphingobacterium faecium]MDH5828895.1 hypothetical protein [Sphingobacterium faecium]WGQ17026.1 hypothetical protein QG727_22895 [Sphingobacterium faecium]
MKKDIENFKNDILFNDIRRNERSDDFRENIKIAERYIRTHKEGRFTKELWYNVLEMPLIVHVFEIICSKILYHEKLLLLIDELEQKQYQNNWAVSFKPDYYRDIFKDRIKDAKSILRKLRPYIIEETKEYSQERKKRDLEGDLGQFYRGWYI